MPRVAPDALRVRRRRRRRVPEGDRGGAADLQPPGRAARQPRARAHQGAGRPDRDRRVPRAWSRRSCAATGSPSATSTRRRCCSSTTRRPARRRRAPTTRRPTATRASSSASPRPTTRAQRQAGFVTVEVRVPRGDLTPEQFRGLAQIMRDYSGGYARTTVQQNLVLRWVREESVYEVWRALGELGLGEAGAADDRRRRQLPRHRQLQARHHAARWASTPPLAERVEALAIEDPLTRADPHQDLAAARTAAASTTSPTSASPARRSRSASGRCPAYIPHIAGSFEGGRSRSASG